ncbi:MAG TPA: hypothetical protein DHW22_12570 [Planctomycetaceae bacterium]|nr:hypothetical protein [Planctomycetaceae bacterium]
MPISNKAKIHIGGQKNNDRRFGQTVNIANRLQCQAQAGQLVMPEEIIQCALTHGGLDGARVEEYFEADLKGLSNPFTASRIVIDE